MKKRNYFWADDVKTNRLFGYDYCFCHSDCCNKDCGRNKDSESYKTMMENSEGRRIYTAANLSQVCTKYMKGENNVESI